MKSQKPGRFLPTLSVIEIVTSEYKSDVQRIYLIQHENNYFRKNI